MKKRWNYILAIIFFSLAFIKIYMPNLVLNIKDKIDITSLLLIIIGIAFILYKYIIILKNNILWMINGIDINIWIRVLIGIFCLVLVIMKMFNSKLILDSTSINLVIIATVVIIVPDLNNIIQRITKVKTSFGEVELANLSNKVSEVEKEIKEQKNNSKLNYGGIDKNTEERLRSIEGDYKALILIIGIEIETRLRSLITDIVGESHTQSSMHRMLMHLEKTNLFNESQIEVLKRFREVRNRVAHGEIKDKMTDNQLLEIADLGLRILQTLPTEVKNETI